VLIPTPLLFLVGRIVGEASLTPAVLERIVTVEDSKSYAKSIPSTSSLVLPSNTNNVGADE